MESFSALLALCEVTGGFPSQRPVTRSSDVFFDLRLNKRLSNTRDDRDLRSHRAHYMTLLLCSFSFSQLRIGYHHFTMIQRNSGRLSRVTWEICVSRQTHSKNLKRMGRSCTWAGGAICSTSTKLCFYKPDIDRISFFPFVSVMPRYTVCGYFRHSRGNGRRWQYCAHHCGREWYWRSHT